MLNKTVGIVSGAVALVAAAGAVGLIALGPLELGAKDEPSAPYAIEV